MPDLLWKSLAEEAREAAGREPFLEGFLTMTVLSRKGFSDALSHYLSEKLENDFLPRAELQLLFLEAFADSEAITRSAAADLRAIAERDPAARGVLGPFLHYKGFHALESHRIAHWLWDRGRTHLAQLLQSLVSQRYAVDIHPGARIGHGIFIDHATGIVIGETAVVGNDVSMLHEVTLGGTGKTTGDRHPKVGNGVLIGAGAKILGNVLIGEGAKVGAGSVVLADVPPHTTVVGNPAKVAGRPKESKPSLGMDQTIAGDSGEGQ